MDSKKTPDNKEQNIESNVREYPENDKQNENPPIGDNVTKFSYENASVPEEVAAGLPETDRDTCAETCNEHTEAKDEHEHDCDNCYVTGNCPLEPIVRYAKLVGEEEFNRQNVAGELPFPIYVALEEMRREERTVRQQASEALLDLLELSLISEIIHSDDPISIGLPHGFIMGFPFGITSGKPIGSHNPVVELLHDLFGF